MPTRLVLASGNRDKAAEIFPILEAAGYEVVLRPPDLPEPAEDGATLLANARIKAQALVHVLGEPAVADDTGLEVAALDGAPGVYSARFAGDHATYEDNWRKLLRELEGVVDRQARFRTVALALFPDGREVWAEGAVDGVITREPRGSNGFGYDPVFEVDGLTLAERTTVEKNALSHRGRAFRALAALLA